MRNQVINSILDEKLIVIVRGVPSDKLLPLAEAMYNGGVRLIEVTYSADGKVSDEDTANNIKMLVDNFKGKMFIGAGTVLTEKQVELTARAGGSFIISPDTNPEVIKRTVDLGLVSIPGSLTPSEAQLAHRSGADFVKLFPITNMGVDYVKAVRAPLSHIKFLAVGGVDCNNMPEYLKIGICGFGIGSSITDKKLIESGDFEAITKLAEKFVNTAKQ